MEFERITEEDKKDLEELLFHPLNFQDYTTNENIRNTFQFAKVGTILQFVFFAVLVLLDFKYSKVGLGIWFIELIGCWIFYKQYRRKMRKRIFKEEGLKIRFDGEMCQFVNQNMFSKCSDIKYIIFYRNIHFLSAVGHIYTASNSKKTIEELEQFYDEHFQAEFILKNEPFEIKKYMLEPTNDPVTSM